jgi:hypothetical protein
VPSAATPPRVRPDTTDDERAQLVGWLELQRSIIHWKCEELSDIDADRSILPTSPLMTMAGVVSHLREQEVRLAEPLIAGPDQVHGLLRQLEGLLQATLDEAGRPQPHHCCDHPRCQVELVSEVDRSLAGLPDERRGVAVERVQRWNRHLEQSEYPLVSITAVGHRGEKVPRGGQESNRVAVGEHRCRHFGRTLVVPQRTLGVSC